jgi:putative transcriptional regulator
MLRTALGITRLLLLALAAWSAPVQAQDDDAMILVAHPSLRDLDYRQTVLIAAPAPNGGHVGVILNRPTRRPLASLFPQHEPSKKVVDPVYYGGPFSRGALVALVKTTGAPGDGAVALTKTLYMAFRANTIDQIIETTPNEARYYVGYVGWRPGELKGELDRGLWSVLSVDLEMVFRKDTEGLWEELLQQTRRIRAKTGSDPVFAASGAAWKTWSDPDLRWAQAAALAGALSKVMPPR